MSDTFELPDVQLAYNDFYEDYFVFFESLIRDHYKVEKLDQLNINQFNEILLYSDKISKNYKYFSQILTDISKYWMEETLYG